ncbi:probable tRNA (uracil-O(2)-)-methyltransferase isoform X2 [Sphaerodactylus townsendi]|uniref:probable tRNA (uracil-O(2)-)-methyltransferase isoform X2 n=1 Tax=Sphaerodactylus townsendi TaxID=933632 RepID=UPI002026C8EC|nr:probable tRNA (uracil-O(2)-)-methyltransferase isoform X2 [Sphaerodactylus townsendi]
MECVGSAAVLDLAEGAARLPGGFWAAVGVWLEKPQVANKRLSGAHLEESRAMPRPRSSPAGAGPGGGGPRAASSELDVAWQALRCSSLGPLLLGPGPAHVDALLRTLLPKGRPAPARELVVRDVFNGTVTFLPLEQNHEGKFKIKECNIYQIKLLHRKVNEWSLSVLSPSPENYVSDGIVYPKTTWLGNELLAKLAKWSLETKKCEFKNTLSLISLARYNNSYQNLKEKYKEIVKVWPEVTDPQKFVYEDVAIAAYLLECAISPNSLFREADWLIGNHSDELTPWIPVMAARSSYSCRYFVLPCCFFDFHGKYNRRQSKKTQYREYLDFVTEVGLVCGFHVEEDCLRIPSTKRVCLIGKSRTYPIIQSAALDEQRARYISRCQCCSMTMPGKVGGFRQRERRPSASRAGGLVADKEVLGNTDMERAFRFQPRGKEPVRNCTALPQDFVDRVVLEVANLLLNGIQRDLSGTSGAWSRGESLTLSEIAARLNEETLKHLRNEYGGLQTLLRNNHQVFEVLSGRVHIRDWREGKLSSGEKPGGTQAEQGAPSKARKTRLCWFAIHHPQGCPMTSGSCSYAHSVEELRPPQRVPKNNPARVPPVDFGSHKEPLPQIMR